MNYYMIESRAVNATIKISMPRLVYVYKEPSLSPNSFPITT